MHRVLCFFLLASILSVKAFFSENNVIFGSILPSAEEPVELALPTYDNDEVNVLPLCRNGGKCSPHCFCPGRCLVGRFSLSRRTCLL